MSDNQGYEHYLTESLKNWEALCQNCGACCGLLDNAPCQYLKIINNETTCSIYENRFGEHQTVDGEKMKCVPIRQILHKHWKGRNNCAYVKTCGVV